MPPLRALTRVAGWLVLALSLGFLGHSLWRTAPWSLAAANAAELAVAIGAGALAYSFAGLLLAEAWRQLLGPGASQVAPRHYHALYGRTQIAKYLPGNCFHFVGRQLLGRELGHGHGALAFASFVETVLLLAVAGILSLPLLGPELTHVSWPLPVWPTLLAMAAVGLILVIVRPDGAWRTPGVSSTLVALRFWAPRLSKAGLLHLGFFTIGGLTLWTLAAAARAPGAQEIDLLGAVSVLALGWWAGFAVPGAAAGAGVREAVLVLTLGQHLGAEGALLVALALRAVTTMGDLLFFGLCCLAPAPSGIEASAISSSKLIGR